MSAPTGYPALDAAINKFETGFSAFVAAAYPGAKLTFMVAAGFTATMATITYTVKGGGAFFKGSDSFQVPGPEVGSGLSFLTVGLLFAAYKLYQARRSPSV